MSIVHEKPIEVLSVYLLKERLSTSSRIYNACISIGDPGFITPSGLIEKIDFLLELRFHDINRKCEVDEGEKPKLPNRYDIIKICNFVNSTKSNCNGYTIHCHAGVHRSVATAMIVLYLLNQDLEYVKKRILEIKAFPLPNKKMLNIFDRLYDSNLSSLLVPFEKRVKDF